MICVDVLLRTQPGEGGLRRRRLLFRTVAIGAGSVGFARAKCVERAGDVAARGEALRLNG